MGHQPPRRGSSPPCGMWSGGIDGRAVSVVGAAGSLAIIPIGSPFAPIASGGRPIAAAPAMVESGSPYLYI